MAPTPLGRALLERALALGFDRAALAPATPIDGGDALSAWIAEARHGSMDYMAQEPERRSRLGTLLDDAAGAVVVAKNYYLEGTHPAPGARVARYARGEDYHEILRARLAELAAFAHAESGGAVSARAATDSVPLLERSLARRAGLGWVGKNTMLIDPERGSYFFIAELIVDADLGAEPRAELPDRCGSCARCIEICPTGAIVAPYLLDARRCISYLTIENRGPIPRRLRPLIGDHLFGCDLCQEACPWNERARPSVDPAFAARPLWAELGPEEILKLTPRAFNRAFANSPVRRAKRSGLLRNAAVVLGNRAQHAPAALLAERLRAEIDPLVRGHLAWALGRTGAPEARGALRAVARDDPDAYVREEARWAIARAT